MNLDEVGVKLDEKDRAILEAMDNLDTVQKSKHDKEKEIVELTESIRQAKHNLGRLRIEKSGLEREQWKLIRQSKSSI